MVNDSNLNATSVALCETHLPDREPTARGKVRDIYDLGDKLIIVATDRISAYDWVNPITDSHSSWLPALEASAQEFRSRIQGTPSEWLNRKISLIDTDGAISGWRILMMLLEHEVHHRLDSGGVGRRGQIRHLLWYFLCP